MKLIEKGTRRKATKKFTFKGHVLSGILCFAYMGVPEDLRSQLPGVWVAGVIFAVNIWAGFGNFVDQSEEKP